jgi:hypothetical protein
VSGFSRTSQMRLNAGSVRLQPDLANAVERR